MDKELWEIIEPILKDYLKSTESYKNGAIYYNGRLLPKQTSHEGMLNFLCTEPDELVSSLEIDFNEEYDKFRDVCEKLEWEKLRDIDKSACSRYKNGESIPELGTILIIAAATPLPWVGYRKDKLSVISLLTICDKGFNPEKKVNQVVKKIYDCLWNSGQLEIESLADNFKKAMVELNNQNKVILEGFDYSLDPIPFLLALRSNTKETININPSV